MVKKDENIKKIIELLTNTNRPLSAFDLSHLLNTSTRTIRNYITEIKAEDYAQVKSTHDGYIINKKDAKIDNHLNTLEEDKNLNRSYTLLSNLLSSSEGVSIFDIADELAVSESTITNSVLPFVKAYIAKYDLQIKSSNYVLYIEGSEKNKRKLIGHLITRNSYGYFSTLDSLENLFPNFSAHDIQNDIYYICQNCNLFLNNFALNNLLAHILVIFFRLQNHDVLNDTEDHIESLQTLLDGFEQKEDIIHVGQKIADNFKTKYDLDIPDEDFKQILILIAVSIDHSPANIESIMDAEFIETIKELLTQTSNRYNVPPFSEEFVLQFSIHMYQARQRNALNVSYPNPIAAQIKGEYAPIYDMAVFFCHRFSTHYQIKFSQDEIGFIAFHFGAYLENNYQLKEKCNCVIIVENYHSFANQLISQLQKRFNENIIISDVISLNHYMLNRPVCDLLLTTIPIAKAYTHQVQINPFITKANYENIQKEIDLIVEEKELKKAQDFLHSLLHEKLYFRNINFNTKEEYIHFIGDQCQNLGYINEDFINDVMLREKLSSTAFTDDVAIPHTISQNAEKSFVCVVHNDTPIPWDHKNIHFILMIGINEQDMKYFKNALDLIVNLFLSAEKTIEIMKTNTFDEFVKLMK